MKNSLLAMTDRTFKIGSEALMFQRTIDAEQNIAFCLMKIEA